MDLQSFELLFHQIDSLWIAPEIKKRQISEELPVDFKIHRCLIKLPKGIAPIIEFNEEINLQAEFEAAPNENIQAGNLVYLHQIKKIKNVKAPIINDTRVAFVFLYWNNTQYDVIFDFTPNIPDDIISKEQKEIWKYGEVIGESFQKILSENTIAIQLQNYELFNTIGLWAAPAIIPYPLSKIAVEIESGNLDVAVEVLVNYCDIKFLRNIIDDWYSLDAFHKRKQLIEDAFFAHTNEKYTLSINALLPHIEGIITDWMYSNVEAGKIPWRQDSKTKKFGQIIMEGQLSSYSYNSIIKSTIQFITQGPVLETFKQWEQQIDNAFPNRHVIEHGKYIDELYTIENSIRLFLLLDTISYIIKK